MNTSTTNTKFNLLWLLISFLLLLTVLISGYKVKQRLAPQITTTIDGNAHCDLRQQACAVALPNGGSVTLSVTPKDIPLLKPLQLEVRTSDITATGVDIDFVGIGMDMGYNHVPLEQTAQTQFQGKALLPVCVRTKMQWEARVTITTRKKVFVVPYRFYTLR